MNPKSNAIRALCSWLDASGVAYQVNGMSVTINNVAIDLDNNAIVGLLATDLEAGISQYKRLLGMAGVEAKTPVDRGVAPRKKVYDDPVLARFRHKEFRTAPNNEAFLIAHNRVIERECRIFQSKNRRLCAELGYDFDDLKSYAMVWATTFAHRSSVMKEGDDNDKILTVYLRQRFTELFNSLVNERRGCLPPSSTIAPTTVLPEEEEEIDEDWAERHDQIKVKSPAARKRKAAALLEENLHAMPHDQMVDALLAATTHICPDSSKLAKKRLNAHIVHCDSCKGRFAKENV